MQQPWKIIYGTLKFRGRGELESGEDVILEIDVQGGEQIKRNFQRQF